VSAGRTEAFQGHPSRFIEASRALAPCPPGQTVITEAFDLAPVRWLIYTVGPIYQGPQNTVILSSAYSQARGRADEVGASSVVFPSISTGVYGYPLGEAAAVSMQALCGVPLVTGLSPMHPFLIGGWGWPPMDKGVQHHVRTHQHDRG